MTTLTRSNAESVSGRRTRTATIVIVATAILLAVAYFPALFDQFAYYDDEGYLLMSIRNFLEHGGLYQETFTQYGPFYYLVTTPIYWISGIQPTHDNGRLIVLAITSLSAGLFGAAAWRITRSVPWTLLCEVGTFLLLISKNRVEPMHPGSLIALLLAVLTFSLAEFAASKRNWALMLGGAAIGGLLMTKVNVGLLAIGAIVLAFAIGNSRLSSRIQFWIVALALVCPFALVYSKIEDGAVALLAMLVSLAVLELCAFSLVGDEVPISRANVASGLVGFLGAVLCSIALPLATGTPPGALIEGVLLRPLRQPDILFGSPPITVNWIVVVVTLSVIALVVSVRRGQLQPSRGAEAISWPALIITAATIWLFSTGITGFAGFGVWLLPIALLPAVVWIVGARSEVRLALRLLVPLAILQVLHAYPVPGSQLVWATVAMAVPFAIAIAAGSEHLRPWTTASGQARGLVIASLCVIFAVAMGLWPVGLWKTYVETPSLELPGASLLRIDELQTQRLRTISQAVRDNCDALWFANFGLGSYYLFSGLPSPTGIVATGWPKVLNREEKKRIVRALSRSERLGKRVCIIHRPNRYRDPTDPLVVYMEGFKEKIASSHHYSVRVRMT